MKYHSTRFGRMAGSCEAPTSSQITAGCGNANVSAIVNTTPPPPRKPHNLFSRNSLIFLFLVVAFVSCDMANPAPTPELSVQVTPQLPIVEGTSATVSISMTPPLSSDAQVAFTIGGEGITPADYTITLLDGTELSANDGFAVTMPAGVPTVLLTLTMANDSDGAETLVFTAQNPADGQYTLKAGNSTVNIPIAVRPPSARYDATTGVLTLTEIDLVDVPGTDDVDMSKLSIVGKGGTDSAIPLTATPTITKVNESEFHLTLNVADRGSILDVLDRNGSTASDNMNYSIALADNWNGTSSPAHASIPIRSTNFPPGYCGNFSATPITVDGTAQDFFDGGTGTAAAPYQLTMRLYCDDLNLAWDIDYPAQAGVDARAFFDITLSTAGTYTSDHTIIALPFAGTIYSSSSDLDFTNHIFFQNDLDDSNFRTRSATATISTPGVVGLVYHCDQANASASESTLCVGQTMDATQGLRLQRM